MVTVHEKHDTPSVAVIGAGVMGAAMARNLLSTGHPVTVVTEDAQIREELRAQGAQVATGAADAVSGASVVITMLPDAKITEQVMFGPDDAVGRLQPDAIWLQMATLGSDGTAAVYRTAQARRGDVVFIDAPVSGSRDPAEHGTLLVLASGDRSRIRERLDTVLDAIARRTIWLPDVGDGSAAKIVLNAWLVMLTEGIAETAALGDRLGVPMSVLADCLRGGPLEAPFAMHKLELMAAGDYRVEMALRWGTKDAVLADQAADGRLPQLAATARTWHSIAAGDAADGDIAAVYQALRDMATGTPAR